MDSLRRTPLHHNGLAYRLHTSPASAREASTALVLRHGIGMSHRYLARPHRELEPFGTVVSFDLPGFGGTPKPEGPVTIEQYAQLIAHALERAGVVKCVVVGHSMGCQFAVELARQHPQLVSRAVLIGPVVDSRRRTLLRQAAALAVDGLREPPSLYGTLQDSDSGCALRRPSVLSARRNVPECGVRLG